MNPEARESSLFKKFRGDQSFWLLFVGFILIAILSLKVDGYLIEGPQNTTARVGQSVTLRCITNTTAALNWRYMKKNSTEEDIYNGDSVDSKLSHLFNGTNDGKGKFELQFKASESTAAMYICVEPGPQTALKAVVTLQNASGSNFGKMDRNQHLIVAGVIVALQMATKNDWIRHLIRGY